MATPPLIELGRLGDGHDYVDIARHSDAVRIPGLAIWRPVEPLFFANAERVLGGVEARLRAAGALHATVLSLEESFDIDSTALDVLIEFDQRLARQGLVVRLARVHDRVRDLLAAGAQALADAGCFRVDDAVSSLKQSG